MQLHVSFTGDFGPSTVSPRSLDSACISKLIKLEGIVTKCSLVRPKVCKSVHFSEATNKFVSKEYRDVASHLGLPTGSALPVKDDDGNVLSTEYGLCVYKDHQVLVIQVQPAAVAPGRLFAAGFQYAGLPAPVTSHALQLPTEASLICDRHKL